MGLYETRFDILKYGTFDFDGYEEIPTEAKEKQYKKEFADIENLYKFD